MEHYGAYAQPHSGYAATTSISSPSLIPTYTGDFGAFQAQQKPLHHSLPWARPAPPINYFYPSPQPVGCFFVPPHMDMHAHAQAHAHAHAQAQAHAHAHTYMHPHAQPMMGPVSIMPVVKHPEDMSSSSPSSVLSPHDTTSGSSIASFEPSVAPSSASASSARPGEHYSAFAPSSESQSSRSSSLETDTPAWASKKSAAAGLLSLAVAAQAHLSSDPTLAMDCSSSSTADTAPKEDRPQKKRRPRPKTTELTPEQLTKMREINRLAAKRHRQQSRKRSQMVQTEVLKFTRDNQKLRDSVSSLSSELSTLRKAVLDLYGPSGPRAKFLSARASQPENLAQQETSSHTHPHTHAHTQAQAV